MSSKTFCDRCGEEIRRNKGSLVKYELILSRETEQANGNVASSPDVNWEICEACRNWLKNTLAQGRAAFRTARKK
jgi:hypothetical protein